MKFYLFLVILFFLKTVNADPGCIDPKATDYDAAATSQAVDQWGQQLCTYASCSDTPGDGCMYPQAWNPYMAGFTAAECTQYGGTPCGPPTGEGCTDPAAFNYDSSATTDDGSCVAVVNGCTNAIAVNHNSAANTDDGSCKCAVGERYDGAACVACIGQTYTDTQQLLSAGAQDCTAHSYCTAGKVVTAAGTATTDTVCDDAPSGGPSGLSSASCADLRTEYNGRQACRDTC